MTTQRLASSRAGLARNLKRRSAARSSASSECRPAPPGEIPIGHEGTKPRRKSDSSGRVRASQRRHRPRQAVRRPKLVPFPTFRSQPRGCRGPIWTREGGKCDMGHPFLGGDTRTPTIRRRGSVTRLLARRALGWPAYWSRASSAADRVAQWLTTMR
jgi:hypothetical protein